MHIRMHLVALVIFAGTFCQTYAQTSPKDVALVRVLLVGNSVTYWNQGLARMLENMAASANPPILLKAAEATCGGCTLKKAWDYYVEYNLLPKDRFDVVVMQDTLGFSYVEAIADQFVEYARRIDVWARQRGSKTVLFMEYIDDPAAETRFSIVDRERMHSELAKELGADVAPIGLAWERVRRERPDLDLFAKDRSHPSIVGSYLMSCVLFCTILKMSPVGMSYVAVEVKGEGEKPSSAEAFYLQSVAWEVVSAYEHRRENE